MKYLSQKDILRHFRDNVDATELKVYYSFVGHYTINGRKSISTGFEVIEPTYMTFKYERDGLMSFGFKDLDEKEEEDENSLFASSRRLFSANRTSDPKFPLNKGIVSHFDHSIDMFDTNNKKIDWDGSLIDRIKFFETKDDAEINFVILLRDYLERNNLIQALSTYDRILDKHTITNPADLLKSI